MRRLSSVRWLIALCVVALPLVSLNVEALAGDPAIYRSRIESMVSGHIPYVDGAFEHLPIAAVPMALAWVLGGALGPRLYTVIFAALSVCCLLVTAILLDRVGVSSGLSPVGRRWVVLVAPMLPIVLFRYDPWVVVLVAATLAATMARQQRTAALLGALAIGAKGWPVVLAVADWLEGRKVRAALSALVSMALAGLLLTLPGLRAARAFSGIHTDTLGGAALTLARTIAGEPVGRFDAAGAIYVDAPAWAYLLGLNVGLVVAALALMRVDVPPSPHAAFALTGALILALLLASPLFSPQFVLWVTPFLALNANRRVRVAGFAVVTLTAVFMFGWNPLYEGNLWWVWVVNLRNVALMMLAVMAAWTVGGVELAVSSEEKRLEHDERPRTVAAVR